MKILPLVHSSESTFGAFPGGAVRTLRNVGITATALCSRTAVLGGMDYDQALTLSDNYITKLELTGQAVDIPPIIGMMMVEYCEQVARLRQPQNCSALTILPV